MTPSVDSDLFFSAESFRDMFGGDNDCETWSPDDWTDIRREAKNMVETRQILLESGLTLTQIQKMKARMSAVGFAASPSSEWPYGVNTRRGVRW